MSDTEQPPSRKEGSLARPADGYHHGSLRAACVEAGVRLVEVGGLPGLTIRGVARLAGVSHTAPLHHFRNREELLDAVADRGFGLLIERLERSLSPNATPMAALRAYGRAYVDHAVAHPGLFAMMFRPKVAAQGEASYRRLVDFCAAGQAAGELPGDDPFRIALMLWSTVHGLATLYVTANPGSRQLAGQPTDPGVAADAILDHMLDALSAAADVRRRA